MGLDQYAYARPPRKRNSDADECITEWRRHNRLQGFMTELWHAKGCPNCNDDNPEEFNCVELPITRSDLDVMEAAIDERAFPQADGFFWGSDSYCWDENAQATDHVRQDYYYLEQDKQFIQDARYMLNEGWRVYYSCWY